MNGRIKRSCQAGFTLVEMIVIVFILGLIGAISLAAFTSGSEALGRVDDDTRGQQDLRIVTERLTRDLRAGRGVHDTSSPSNLSIWIDYDADYIDDASEIIVWDVVANAADSGHFDVRRTAGSATPEVVGRAVIDALAFRYYRDDTGTAIELVPADNDPETSDPLVPATSLVEVSMDYDAIVGAYLNQKTNTYRIRLRNTE